LPLKGIYYIINTAILQHLHGGNLEFVAWNWMGNILDKGFVLKDVPL